MTSTFARLRRSRIALTLALLAVVAQFGLALASATHQARLLAQGSGALGEVCTVASVERAALAGDRSADPGGVPPSDAKLADCAVCAATGLLAAPEASAPGVDPPPVATVCGPTATTAPIAARFDPLPPPRAPPPVS